MCTGGWCSARRARARARGAAAHSKRMAPSRARRGRAPRPAKRGARKARPRAWWGGPGRAGRRRGGEGDDLGIRGRGREQQRARAPRAGHGSGDASEARAPRAQRDQTLPKGRRKGGADAAARALARPGSRLCGEARRGARARAGAVALTVLIGPRAVFPTGGPAAGRCLDGRLPTTMKGDIRWGHAQPHMVRSARGCFRVWGGGGEGCWGLSRFRGRGAGWGGGLRIAPAPAAAGWP
jgi:hypothetical protein